MKGRVVGSGSPGQTLLYILASKFCVFLRGFLWIFFGFSEIFETFMVLPTLDNFCLCFFFNGVGCSGALCPK